MWITVADLPRSVPRESNELPPIGDNLKEAVHGYEKLHIENVLRSTGTDKRKAEFQKYMAKLRAQAIIEWKNPDVRKAFEEGLKQQGAASQ